MSAEVCSGRALRQIATLAVLAPLVAGLAGCEWFSDFKRQPSLMTWEPVRCDARRDRCADTIASRGNPQLSVPITGTFRAGFVTSYRPLPATVDSLADLANPTPPTAASLANGRKYYQINCAVCHGDKGMGDGPATRYGMPGINLTTTLTQSRTDGYIYGMIRNGRGAMPTYNRIEEMDRWDVVNYVRGLQGKLAAPVATGPLAAPGVTGRWVPGPTRDAPTRQPPFVPPAVGSASAFYPPGVRPPATDPAAPPVGPPLPDSNVYRTGLPRSRDAGVRP